MTSVICIVSSRILQTLIFNFIHVNEISTSVGTYTRRQGRTREKKINKNTADSQLYTHNGIHVYNKYIKSGIEKLLSKLFITRQASVHELRASKVELESQPSLSNAHAWR